MKSKNDRFSSNFQRCVFLRIRIKTSCKLMKQRQKILGIFEEDIKFIHGYARKNMVLLSMA